MSSRPMAAEAPHIAERERELQERERQLADRERDLAEQRRVLAEQHRIVAAMSTTEVPTRTPESSTQWPPRREPPAQRYRYVVQRRETRSFWRRLRDTLFGIEPVLEDSL